MAFLNYHHLRYFRAVANDGNLTRVASRLRVSQSALSMQIRSLERSLGRDLFTRTHRRLHLTETGRLVLEYAETIFRAGDELMTVLERDAPGHRKVLSVGAVATLSRNFQMELLRPLVHQADLQLVIRSGSLRDLLAQMRKQMGVNFDAHTLDVVLSNLAVKRDADTGWHSHLLAEQPASIVSKRPRGRAKRFRFPEDLKTTPIVLPSLDTSIRVAFDLLMERAGIRPLIAAEVDDMATLRLMAVESEGVTLVPPVVVLRELRDGALVERHRIREITEKFYAITPTRRFPNELVRKLVRIGA